MSKQVQLFLIPSRGAKPEFLAILEPSDNDGGIDEWDELPSKINLEGYTRDSWAWKPHSAWKSQSCVSVDGKHKLVGFVQYLKERQKSAFGRYTPTSCMVISYLQTTTPHKASLDGTPASSSATASALKINVTFTNEISLIPNNPFSSELPPSIVKQQQQQQQQRPLAAKTALVPKTSSTLTKSGLLGNLLGAQQRTNHHLQIVPAKKLPASTTNTLNNSRTAAQVLAEFRSTMEQTMLDFDLSSEQELSIQIQLADIHAGLSQDVKEKVTMETLTFMVFEQADEVNEEWIAHKEQGEFMDDVTIIVYKEGHAPDDILEEINKVELTEEMRGQQMAMQQARQKQATKEEKQLEAMKKERVKQEYNEDEDFSALNTRKRDRRTIEEIQRDMDICEVDETTKRSRGDDQ